MLEIKDFSLKLRGSDGRILPVLEQVSIKIDKGTCLGIAGESGSGKSVLAMSIADLLPFSTIYSRTGSIVMNNISLLDISQKQMQKIRGAQIGFIFQEPMTAMNPLMTLYDQIAETVYVHCRSIKKEAAKEMVLNALKRSGFKEPEKFLSSYPHQLSGGMRQRAMIAMATVLDPELIIADEPTTAIDAALQVQLLFELRQRIERDHHSMIFISHDLGVLRSVSDNLIILYAGCVVESGSTARIIENPAHPYTADLISALPRLIENRELPVSIPGFLPSPDQKPTGCVYSDRCRIYIPECCDNRPPLVEIEPRHHVACCNIRQNSKLVIKDSLKDKARLARQKAFTNG